MPWDEFIKTGRVFQRKVIVYKFNNNYTGADTAQNDSGTLVNFVMENSVSPHGLFNTERATWQMHHYNACSQGVRMMHWKGGRGRTSPRRGRQRGDRKFNKHGDGEMLVLVSLHVSRLGRDSAHSAVLNLTVGKYRSQ